MNKLAATQLSAEVQKLREQLTEAEENLRIAQELKETDPVRYLAKLIYANETSQGTYGYEYGQFGDRELQRAKEVLDTVEGYVGIAEAVIIKFHIT